MSNISARMRVGADDFYILLTNTDIYVDNSLFIQEVLDDSGDIILITRPRRWSKTLIIMILVSKLYEILELS